MLRFPIVIFLASLGWAGSVAADPCKAIPDVGPTPSNLSPGSEFRGMVAYVGDGDSFCVALANPRAPGDFPKPRLSPPPKRLEIFRPLVLSRSLGEPAFRLRRGA